MKIIRGDDVTITVTCKNGGGVAVDITGYSVFFTAKQTLADADSAAVISKKVTSHTNPTAGITAIVLSHAETDIVEGDYVYDFQLIDPSGNITSSSRDYLSVVKDVTQRVV